MVCDAGQQASPNKHGLVTPGCFPCTLHRCTVSVNEQPSGATAALALALALAAAEPAALPAASVASPALAPPLAATAHTWRCVPNQGGPEHDGGGHSR